MIKNKTKFKLSAYRLVIGIMALALVASIGGFFAVKAYNGDAKIVVEGNYIEATQPGAETPTLGAGGWSPATLSDEECINDDCTFYLTQIAYDASTTIASFTDPFTTATSTYTTNSPILKGSAADGNAQVGATSTVESVKMVTLGVATSTYTLNCGASATKFYNAALTPQILSVSNITTSSLAYLDSRATSTDSGLNFVSRANDPIVLTPAKPYLLCYVSSVYTGAFTEVTNTFKATFKVRISRPNF